MMQTLPTTLDAIEATFLRTEGQYAVVQHDVFGAFYLPAPLLPAGLKENEKLLLKVTTKQKEEQQRVEGMRSLLEQMIN